MDWYGSAAVSTVASKQDRSVFNVLSVCFPHACMSFLWDSGFHPYPKDMSTISAAYSKLTNVVEVRVNSCSLFALTLQ